MTILSTLSAMLLSGSTMTANEALNVSRNFLQNWDGVVYPSAGSPSYDSNSGTWTAVFLRQGLQVRVYVLERYKEVVQVTADSIRTALIGGSIRPNSRFASLSAASAYCLQRCQGMALGMSLQLYGATQPNASWPAPRETPARIVECDISPKVFGFRVADRGARVDIDSETGELLGYFGNWQPFNADPPPQSTLTQSQARQALGQNLGRTMGVPLSATKAYRLMNSGRSRLSWHFKYPNTEYWVDAASGDVIKRVVKKGTGLHSGKDKAMLEAEQRFAPIVRQNMRNLEKKRDEAWKRLLSKGHRPTKRLPLAMKSTGGLRKS